MDTTPLYNFLASQKHLILATCHDGPWVCTVYYGITDDLTIYFISSTEEEHSTHILGESAVAFATAWFDKEDHANRKGVQGRGECRIAATDAEIKTGTNLHNQRFPEFAGRITPDYITSEGNNAAVWILEPRFIKYWDDELYEGGGPQEFHL